MSCALSRKSTQLHRTTTVEIEKWQLVFRKFEESLMPLIKVCPSKLLHTSVAFP
jgi:hypothetical protein